MKLKQLSLACGLALTAMGAQAATQDAFFSGSSALDPTIQRVFADLCTGAAGDAKLYASKAGINGADAASGSGKVFVCTAKAGNALGYTAGDTVRWFKNSGGSGYGITNVAGAGTALPMPVVAGASCAADTAATVGGVPFTRFKNCNVANLTPKIGASDVEPDLLVAYNGVTAAAAGGVTYTPLVAQGFGVAVNETVYKALQTEQKAKGLITSTCVVGDFTEACAPSLSSAVIRGMFSGAAPDWSATIDTSATGAAAALLTGYNTAVTACRRFNDSGTQATITARIAGASCLTGSRAATFIDNTGDNNLGNDGGPGTGAGQAGLIASNADYTVVMNDNSDQMKACLTNAEASSAASLKNMAIGILGLDAQPGGSDKWKYVKVDGAYPSNNNMIDGKYDLWAESGLTVSNTVALAGNDLAVYNYVSSKLSLESNLRSLGLIGLAAIPNPLATPAVAWGPSQGNFGNASAGNAVMIATRNGDTCAPAGVFK